MTSVALLQTRHSVSLGKSDMVGGKLFKEETCISLQEGPYGRGGSGCNPSRDPFAGPSVTWSTSSFNENPQKFVLYGVAADNVAALSLKFGSAIVPLTLSEDSGFIYVVEKPEIAQTDLPQEVIGSTPLVLSWSALTSPSLSGRNRRCGPADGLERSASM